METCSSSWENGTVITILFEPLDEWQAQVRPSDTEKYIELALKAFEMAGEFYNYNVPILGDAKKGRDWAMTH